VIGELTAAWERLAPGEPEPFQGQLLRPLVAWEMAGADAVRRLGDRFWMAALAVQLAHEASLLHDDVVDAAPTRRGRATLAASRGVGAALIQGDLLLARAYRASALTGSPAFQLRFAEAVEGTIRGELAQGERAGLALGMERYLEIVRGKSGELFGCAAATAATLEEEPRAESLADLGRGIGILYQMVDDLLDLCPGAGTGKDAGRDVERGLWTWPLAHLPPGVPGSRLFAPDPSGRVPGRAALAALQERCVRLTEHLSRALPAPEALIDTLVTWCRRARQEVEAECDRRGAEALRISVPSTSAVGNGVPRRESAELVLAREGRSFHFASRLFPPAERARIARAYAFCREADDLVDRAPDAATACKALSERRELVRAVYDGSAPATGSLEAIREMRERDIPLAFAEALLEGMAMDLEPREYADMAELRVYTHRVAGVVGLWMTALAGCDDPWALRMAAEMGHAMQLTNIARDVGADLRLGRLYLPLDLLGRHGLNRGWLERLEADPGLPIPAEFAAALEELMGLADASYGAAFHALTCLPEPFRRPVAVAAQVYGGIHDEIRGAGYDTLRRRAHTSTPRKLLLGATALRRLRRSAALERP
jgi:15-cis-phytoene synthase